jgi:CO dehydrogenase/acetyl-CoA synthase delta subunit
LIITSYAEYKDQLLALGVIPGAPGSETQALASLKADLDIEKDARVAAQVEADVLSWAVRDRKVSANKFATQIPILEDKDKHLEDKVMEGLKEVRARELCLEHTTQANDNYQKEVT